jgi:transcriptional regulator with XRE-family HTH domain
MSQRAEDPESVRAIAKRLIATRVALGLNQAEWCRRVGISPQAWSNYESARNRINHDQALRVCKAIGVSLDWIYRGEASILPHNLAISIRSAMQAGDKSD